MKGLVDEFQGLSDEFQEQLTKLLDVVKTGRVPSKDEMALIASAAGSLQEKYDAVYEMTASEVEAERLPEKGLSVSIYVKAVEDSRIRALRARIENAQSLLTRFLRVKSLIAAYSEALVPFQKDAEELLVKIGNADIEDAEPLLSQIAAPELFLRAMDADFNDCGSVELLEEISRHYPKRIQWGLAGGNYFTDGQRRVQKEDTEDGTKTGEAKSDMLTVVNRIKTSVPGAASFRKEIVRLAKTAQMIRIVLPMMTNLGALTKEQAYLFGVGMDCYENEEQSRKEADRAFDVLASKGIIAHYRYFDKDSVVDAYGLTSYCYGCMQKSSIASLRMFWGITIGDYKFCGDVQIEKSKVAAAVRNNAVLLEYFYGIKSQLSEEDYRAVKESIHWLGSCYQATVFYDGKPYQCCVPDMDADFSSFKDKNILLVWDRLGSSFAFGGECGRIFVFKNGKIYSCGSAFELPEQIKRLEEEEQAAAKQPLPAGPV